MNRIDSGYKLKMSPESRKEAIVQGDTYRFTVLTPQMIRMEYSRSGKFEDRATQIVIHRDFPVPDFRVVEKADSLEIITAHLHLTYNKQEFSKNGLSIQVKGKLSHYRSLWHFGEPFETLKGTARTLDESNGPVPLENGLLSRNGFSIIDDSKSLLIEDDGWVTPREADAVDVYFLGYGREYLTCLRDFYKLCGETPLLPRYALGNWWSRFYPYTETSYKDLMKRFKEEGVPFSVCVLDMDWHLRDIDPKYGSGWTGYTWNKSLFPDPELFLDWLHKEGLHVTLNVHPADGVRAHEEMYTEMAKALHVDYANEDKIHFDMTSPEFMQAYFRYLHHPNEEMGVDFWWIDWQQGSTSRIEGLDPLWMLNHYHFLDNRRRGKRPLTFSRYAGIGSHRYPVGFSGDTFATWETLDFQPYFTATASNAGYGWWSHDIGGHMHGTKSDEMAVRWIQFGVFSPIMRIHSSDNPFNVKEPWQYNAIAENTMKRFLRLRHQLVPYIYTMNRRFNEHGEPLVQPMYYRNPEDGAAYEVPNEYYFGDLIVCPITSPMSPELNLGLFKAWLPEGIYFDLFTGRSYRGGRKIDMYRDIATIPVLAKAGSILPMVAGSSVKNAADNPEDMEIHVFAGNDGAFELYEDNGKDVSDGGFREARTLMEFTWGKKTGLTIRGYTGHPSVVPERRNYILKFAGLSDAGDISVSCGNDTVPFEKKCHKPSNTLELIVNAVETNKELTVLLGSHEKIAENNVEEELFNLLNKAQIEFDLKSTIYWTIKNHTDKAQKLAALQVLNLENNLRGALFELITA